MNYDIVIMGGGIIGSAAAYFLACDGGGARIAVIEPDPTYEFATTPQAAGGIRQLFSVPENIAMSTYSLDFYDNFEHHVGFSGYDASIDFQRHGYLFVVGPDGADTLVANSELQESMDVQVELLDTTALNRRFPSLGTADIELGCYSPNDGWIDPNSALRGFRQRAEHDGVTYLRTRVIGLTTEGQSVASAQLESGESVQAAYFLNTAGPWTAKIARMIAVEIPVKPMCRVQHFWRCDTELEPMPLVKDESGMFFRPEGSGFVGGCPSFEIEPGFVTDIDRGYFANYFESVVWPLLATRAPKFESIKLERSWAGHYAENLFDGNMIIGALSPKCENLFTACGFSGHGIMHAPAVGRALSELVLHRQYQTLDLSAFEMKRIHDGQPYAEKGIK